MDDKNGTMPKATPCPPKTLKTGADETKMENVPDVQTADVIKKEDRNDRNMSASSPPKMLKTMADEIKMNNVPDAQMALPIKVEDSSDRSGKEPTPPPPLELQDLPDEVLLKVFTELRLQDLTSCAHSCRRWQDLIRGRKRLWRGKMYTACKASQYKLALKMMQLMPKFETVRFVNSWRPALHLIYPEAVLVFNNGKIGASFPKCTFNAENVIVSTSVADNSEQNFLTCLNVKSVKMIQIADQCETSFTHWRTIFNSPANRKYCDKTECSLHLVKATLHNVPLKRCKWPPKRLAGAEWPCPSLQQLCITADIVGQKAMESFCQLGPIRVLCVKGCRPPFILFLRRWNTQLEVLLLKKPFFRFINPHTDLFSNFLNLKNLKKLEISY